MGSIKEGKYADFLLLDKNVLDYKGSELRTIGDTKILSTYFEGNEEMRYIRVRNSVLIANCTLIGPEDERSSAGTRAARKQGMNLTV